MSRPRTCRFGNRHHSHQIATTSSSVASVAITMTNGRDGGGITFAIRVDSVVVTSGSATTNTGGSASAATTTIATVVLPIRRIHGPVISPRWLDARNDSHRGCAVAIRAAYPAQLGGMSLRLGRLIAEDGGRISGYFKHDPLWGNSGGNRHFAAES